MPTALLFAALAAGAAAPASELEARLRPLLRAHPGKTGVFMLERGEEALLARAWLADRAARSIDVQYFIWSSDNVGTLAAEALLRAAERGVRVRVLVDDLMIDAPPEALLALAAHPSVEIRIYNPALTVGVSWWARLRNAAADLKGVNQRMHDKTFVADGLAAITGGRNMADEYFDYDQVYNFRDRDALLLGGVVSEVSRSFEAFWADELAVPVERLVGGADWPSPERTREAWGALRRYADDPANFAPPVRSALAELEKAFPELLRGLAWVDARFLSDRPGKNLSAGLGGGGRTTEALAELVRSARRKVTIESPYLVLPEGGLELFSGLVQRGVRVRIVTNSLASTDNLMAFGGYARQRRALLAAGIDVREFRPDAAVLSEVVRPSAGARAPMLSLHAKTLVVDGELLFVGSFNLDPRSANLNTEVGVLVRDARLAAEVEAAIEADMRPENSWDAGEAADALAPLGKRLQLRLWKLLPIDPLL